MVTLAPPSWRCNGSSLMAPHSELGSALLGSCCEDADHAEVPFTELMARISRSKESAATAGRPPQRERRPPQPPFDPSTAGPFAAASSVSRLFHPEVGFLKPKDFGLWDQERISAPERMWPAAGAASELYDHQRKGQLAWRPGHWSRSGGSSRPPSRAPSRQSRASSTACPPGSEGSSARPGSAASSRSRGGSARPKGQAARPWSACQLQNSAAEGSTSVVRAPSHSSSMRPVSAGRSRPEGAMVLSQTAPEEPRRSLPVFPGSSHRRRLALRTSQVHKPVTYETTSASSCSSARSSLAAEDLLTDGDFRSIDGCAGEHLEAYNLNIARVAATSAVAKANRESTGVGKLVEVFSEVSPHMREEAEQKRRLIISLRAGRDAEAKGGQPLLAGQVREFFATLEEAGESPLSKETLAKALCVCPDIALFFGLPGAPEASVLPDVAELILQEVSDGSGGAGVSYEALLAFLSDRVPGVDAIASSGTGVGYRTGVGDGGAAAEATHPAAAAIGRQAMSARPVRGARGIAASRYVPMSRPPQLARAR